MKTNGKKLIKAGLLTLVLFIGFSAFSQAPDMQLSYVNGWLDQLWPTLKDTLTIILGFAGGYFLAALGILYVRNSEDEKRKNQYLMGGLVLAGAATILAFL